MPHKWEFPGGKIRPDEKPEECLCREIDEELGIQIVTTRPLKPATHDYSTFTITLYPFICSIISGDMKLHEHEAVIWLPPAELSTLEWAEADLPVLTAYCRKAKK